ncbi:3-phosphoshikimate 1-carboxyvinyltransferase [Dokdonia sinensis]|uniref:3-phosphoshikimate 1-carboxyvinyltransferase n=1 Tax=Dokdonia sinensis TaxID=2479847 RepID=A0A3M0FVW2_9FLAO|nr:3-phosphoshikimate 1-carboxyvinyltransferase [Dokdonia sinensis]RMB56618.1 3-phosphoshikimate 1-carboxyvinyltransferase [Dokdonia sinensis]
MLLKVSHKTVLPPAEIVITGSKSESNRLLILQALFDNLTIDNVSNSDDAAVMQKALASTQETVNIHHAGTAMRFLTAYFSIQEGRKTVLTGSERMQERPMKILVEALQTLGADISYVNNEGYPPLRIKGKLLQEKKVSLQANVSSQYISALMLIGGALPEGLEIHLEGKITSIPYIEMTLALLLDVGIQGSFKNQIITIQSLKQKLPAKKIVVESDWSSASYYFSIVALSARQAQDKSQKQNQSNSTISISSYKKDSLQGDSVLQSIYAQLGVYSKIAGHQLNLSLIEDFNFPEQIRLDLSKCPDIAQTIAVTCLGLGISCDLTGLHTLKIKETDRLEALREEISKLGGNITVTNDSLHLEAQTTPLTSGVSIATYHDHRMAMAFAPLAMLVPLQIEDAGVVSKSYPDFWSDLEQLGFLTEQV